MASAAVCRQRAADADAPGGPGALRRIAVRLEEAYGTGNAPRAAPEPEAFADRLQKWKSFRECAARTFVARQQAAARGVSVRGGAAGDAVVEECATQGAVAEKDPEFCRRLDVDYADQRGQPGLPAWRCWDARARVLGKPDECPVVPLGGEVTGRNPECLAVARRDASLCAYAEEPGRCRALVAGEPARCPTDSRTCRAALAYWAGLVPSPTDPEAARDEGRVAFLLKRSDAEVRWDKLARPLGLGWPTGTEPVRIAVAADFALWFRPHGRTPGHAAWDADARGAAGLRITLDRPGGPVTCEPDAATRGDLRWDAHAARMGALLAVELDASALACSDGRGATLAGSLALPIIDVR